MDQLIQAAMDAARQGNKKQATEYLRQVLMANPNDLEATLLLGSLVDEPDRKRQIYNRVLSLDPVNKVAREELLKLDRMAMGSFLAQMEPPPPVAQPKPVSPPPAPVQQKEITQPKKATASAPIQQTAKPIESSLREQVTFETPKPSILRIQKPIVFKYPIVWRIVMYLFVIVFGCGGLLVASESFSAGLPLLALGVLFGLTTLSLPPGIEVSDKGIRVMKMLGGSEMRWGDMAQIKPNGAKRNLVLVSSKGETLKVSTQLKGYPAIVEILRQKRPDLLGIKDNQVASNDLGGPSFTSTQMPKETKVFRKNFFAQYSVFFLLIPLCLVGAWATITMEEKFAGIAIGLIGAVFIAFALFSTNQITVKPNKLVFESFMGEKTYTAKQIKEISMKTVRGRYGRATNYVNVQPTEGIAVAVAGFSEGDEVIYGYLVNWWETYRYK
ncbi:MAG: hypothetical protein IPP66_02170 [Anaerolineales bacterium]|nr:hypothetical protein [Anaerolineales bacterium]